MAEEFRIEVDDLTRDATRELVRLHVTAMAENSPKCHVYALDSSGLARPDVTLFTAWLGDEIAAMGALRQHDAELGEVKSMRTRPEHLRKGAAAAILEHIIAEARSRGLSRLCLETGSGDAFEPALALYRRRGFAKGEAFGDYTASQFNQFFHLALA